MSDRLSHADFVAKFSAYKLGQLKEMAKADGVELVAMSKDAALDELWQVYTGQIKPERAAPAPKPATSAPGLVPGAPVALDYECRMAGPKTAQARATYRRAGYVITREWAKLSPAPSDEQLELLKADSILQVRIAP